MRKFVRGVIVGVAIMVVLMGADYVGTSKVTNYAEGRP
jgi:hypothetical protein